MGVYIVMKEDDGWVSTLPGRKEDDGWVSHYHRGRKMMGGCNITIEEGR